MAFTLFETYQIRHILLHYPRNGTHRPKRAWKPPHHRQHFLLVSFRYPPSYGPRRTVYRNASTRSRTLQAFSRTLRSVERQAVLSRRSREELTRKVRLCILG